LVGESLSKKLLILPFYCHPPQTGSAAAERGRVWAQNPSGEKSLAAALLKKSFSFKRLIVSRFIAGLAQAFGFSPPSGAA
jgi:hypothetical protein